MQWVYQLEAVDPPCPLLTHRSSVTCLCTQCVNVAYTGHGDPLDDIMGARFEFENPNVDVWVWYVFYLN